MLRDGAVSGSVEALQAATPLPVPCLVSATEGLGAAIQQSSGWGLAETNTKGFRHKLDLDLGSPT